MMTEESPDYFLGVGLDTTIGPGFNDNLIDHPPQHQNQRWNFLTNETNAVNRSSGYTENDMTPYPDYTQIGFIRGLFVSLFLIEFVVSVTGNLLVCLTVLRNKSMHSPVNYYIVNLGICDFLIGAFVLPAKLIELIAETQFNPLNDISCTVLRFFETVVIFVSVFTLVAICMERYYAIVYPMESRVHMTDNRIRRVIIMVWIIPILVAGPNLYPAQAMPHHLISKYGEFTRLTCFDEFSDQFRMWYFFFLFFFMYFLPLIIVATTCCSITRALMTKIIIQPYRDQRAITLERGRRKVAKMVLVIVCTFVFCWSPYFFVTIITQLQTVNFLHQGQFFFTMLSINLLCFTNSCVNPIVYFSMSARFRRGVRCLLRSFFRCRKRSRYSPDPDISPSSVRRAVLRRGAIRSRPPQHNHTLSYSHELRRGENQSWVISGI